MIVENKPGMILSIGADAVAKAPPDGYTILITSVTSSHAANLFNFKKLPYDPIKDFTPVATLQRSYFILMVRAEAPWKTVAELTAAMKEKGDKASYGYGSPPALASSELYKARAGLQAVGIPYRTSMASLPEMFSGELDFQFIDATQGTPLLAARQAARARGHHRPARAGRRHADHGGGRQHSRIRHRAGLGRVPAGRCAGSRSWRGWNRWFAEIVKMDATRQFLANTHGAPFPGGAKELADFIPKEIKKWEELAKLAKIEPQ